MRWGKTTDEKHYAKIEWRTWFAWRPVQITNGTWVWLEKIQRRQDWLASRGYYYQYSLPAVPDPLVAEVLAALDNSTTDWTRQKLETGKVGKQIRQQYGESIDANWISKQ